MKATRLRDSGPIPVKGSSEERDSEQGKLQEDGGDELKCGQSEKFIGHREFSRR